MFDIATIFVLRHEERFTGECGPPIPQDKIDEACAAYETLTEEFLDDVFGYEDQLPSADWHQKVLETTSWVFCAQMIRDKLGYNCSEGPSALEHS